MTKIVEILRTFCAYVVVDTPSYFDDKVLNLIEMSDDVLLVAGMDIPNIKNVKIGLQTLRLLNTPMSKLHLVLNRANSKVKLDVSEVERTLQVKAEVLVPSDVVVPQSVNKGAPVVLDAPKAGVSRSSSSWPTSSSRPRRVAARSRSARPRSPPLPPRSGGGIGRFGGRLRPPERVRVSPLTSHCSEPMVWAMSLYKRLHEVNPQTGAPTSKRRDPVLDELRQKIHHHLIDELGPILYDKRLSEDDLRRRVHEQLTRRSPRSAAPLSAADKAQLIQDVSDDILGYGPIDQLLKDENISEVMVNGPDSVYVERSGKVEKTAANFVDETHLRRIIDKIVGQVGRRIDESTPMVDARLPDGSRVNAVIHPLAIGGPFLTIRSSPRTRTRSTT